MTGTANGKILIYETTPPFEQLELQFVPSSIKGSRRGSFATVAAAGQNLPSLHYTGGDNSLTIPVKYQMLDGEPEFVMKKLNWLESLIMNDGNVNRARIVGIVYGTLFRQRLFVLTGLSYTIEGFIIGDLLPANGSFDLTFKEVSSKNKRIEDVRNNH